MKKNIGIVDRIIRFVLFDLFIGANLSALEIASHWRMIFFAVAIILLFTIVTGFSVIYKLIGFSTVQEKSMTTNQVSESN